MTDRSSGNPDWPLVPILEACESIIDCVNKTAPLSEAVTPYKMLRTTNVRDGFVDVDNCRYVSEETFVRWTRRQRPRRNDVILTREAPLGEVAILRSDETVFLGQRLISYRVDPLVNDPHFLLYSLMSPYLQGQIRAAGSGSTVEHMRVPDAERLMVRLPDLPTQQRIAGVLSAYDGLIQVNQRRIAILEEMSRRLFDEWFVQLLGKRLPIPGDRLEEWSLPKGWEFTSLSDTAVLVMGQSPSSKDYGPNEKGLPFHQGVTDFEGRFIRKRHFIKDSLRWPRVALKDDILFSVRAPVGRLALATEEIALGRGLSAIRAKNGQQFFLFSHLMATFPTSDMFGSGTIYKAVTKGDIQKIPLLSPPASLRSSFDSIAKAVWGQIRTLAYSNFRLRVARDLLLPKLISGEIEVGRAEQFFAEAAE